MGWRVCRPHPVQPTSRPYPARPASRSLGRQGGRAAGRKARLLALRGPQSQRHQPSMARTRLWGGGGCTGGSCCEGDRPVFSPQKQTEFELITLKDWPVRDAACHVEGLNPTLRCHVLFPCSLPPPPPAGMHQSFWGPRRQPGPCRHPRPATPGLPPPSPPAGRVECLSVLPPTV